MEAIGPVRRPGFPSAVGAAPAGVAAPADDEPLALFWFRPDKDDQLAAALLGVH